jgi:predicted acyl esterase
MMKKNYLLFLFLLNVHSMSALLTWTTYEIPMSDEMTLEGDVYLPDNWTAGPVILIQTPYNKNLSHFVGLPLGIGYAQEDMEYAIVICDWRGFFGSTDALYAGAPSRGQDGYDVVEWIAEQSWCNGKVGTWGPSALGRVQFMTAREHPPHLVCMVPVVAAPTYTYLEYYSNGAARTEYLEQLDALGFGTSPVVYAHPEKDFTWDFAESANDYPDEIEIPALMIGGWYDHNVETMIATFSDLQTLSLPAVQTKHKLLMGPWTHGGHGTASVGSGMQGELEYPEAVGWSVDRALEFFDFYLKDEANGWENYPAVTYFQMGDNEWLTSNQWPVSSTAPVKLFFQNDNSLKLDLPNSSQSLSLNYDPQNPSVTIGGPTLRNDLDQGPYDQSILVESADDILVFTSVELTSDVTVKGSVTIQISISTDVVDTDVAVRLCDVYPDGRSMLVCDGIYRMRFANGFEPGDAIELVPGELYSVQIEMPNTALTFKQGHRIRVDVTGSNYPRFNRNMNTGGEMYPDLNGDTLVNPLIAHDQIWLSTTPTNGSFVILPVEGSFPISVAETKNDSPVILYPNPTHELLHITLPDYFLNTAVAEIYSTDGRLFLKENIQNKIKEINIEMLPRGSYELRILDDVHVISESFIVE